MKRKKIICGLLIAIAPTVANAQGNDVRKQGDRACKADVTRYCKAVFNQGDMAILQCLQTNRAKLNRPCSSFLKEVGQL
jgi:hypothetical protein